MIIETLALSFLIGKLRGGKIKNLESLYFNGWILLVIGYILEIIVLLIYGKTNGVLSHIISDNFFYFHSVIYILLILGLALSKEEKGMDLVLIGAISNFLAMITNKGKMPVFIKSLEIGKLYSQINILEEGRILTHTLGNREVNLFYLTDIIPIGKPYPFPKVISVGDILIALGLFILIQYYMTKDTQITKPKV